MNGDNTLTVIVPARNEERCLAQMVSVILDTVPRYFSEYEILIIDDSSTDNTLAVARQLADIHDKIRVIHNDKSRNLGGVMKQGLSEATMSYVMRTNGSGTERADSLARIFEHKDEADVIIPWLDNMHERTRTRRWISILYQWILNKSFRLNIRYFNHSILCRTALLRSIFIRTNSYAYPSEAIIKLVKTGRSYVEVPVSSRYDSHSDSSTKAFRPRNAVGVAVFYFTTLWDVYVTRRFTRSPEGK